MSKQATSVLKMILFRTKGCPLSLFLIQMDEAHLKSLDRKSCRCNPDISDLVGSDLIVLVDDGSDSRRINNRGAYPKKESARHWR